MAQKRNDLKGLTGVTFLERIASYEAVCATATLKAIPKLGQKAPLCYEVLGMTLALLDCAASCYWGCAKGDHRLENLIGRSANSAYAALTLAVKGYYDQALSIARTLGENANLLSLFSADAASLQEWKTATELVRKKKFSAIKVRLAIEALNGSLPIDQNRYSQLSNYSIHSSQIG